MGNDMLAAVREVYSGPEGELWRLIMGEQIHVGGLASSQALCEKAGIRGQRTGVDLGCCLGGGIRFLLRYGGVGTMTGVDATAEVIAQGRRMCEAEGVADRVRFIHAEATVTGLPSASCDFVWGEDAWCYVADKAALIAEAVRLVRPGGVVAFTDWVEGAAGMSDAERDRFNAFMKFPNVATVAGYRDLLAASGCTVAVAEDTGAFARHVDLYLDMLGMQLTYDALRILGFDQARFAGLAGEMRFMQELAHAGKIAQGRFVAARR